MEPSGDFLPGIHVSERSLNSVVLPHIRFHGGDAAGFRRALNARVERYLADCGDPLTAGPGVMFKALFYASVAVSSYAFMLESGSAPRLCAGFALVYGLATLLLVVNVSHDAAHSALTGNRRLDSVVHRALFMLLGVDGYLWQMRHIGSHHVFPNVNGSDIDIDENPFLRLSPNHPCMPYHRYQHLYAVPVYMLTLLHSIFVGDLMYLRKKELANMRNIRHTKLDIAIFFAAKLMHLAINLAIPMSLLPFAWWQIALGYAAVSGAMSLVFIFLLVGTHFSFDAAFPKADAAGVIHSGWAEHALATSVDWCPESRLAAFLSGGANAHAAHHLFPRLSHAHGPALSRIIRATAADFDLPYHEKSFPGLLCAHFAHLNRLGREGAPE